ncbi:MAG: universal stress protein, partial [Bacillota bacterium]
MIFEGKLLLSINSFKSAVKLIECIDELIGLGLDSVFVIYVIEAGRSGISMGIINEYQEKLENIKLNISAKGLAVNSKLVIGVPHKEIIKAADEYDCSVILISSHNQSLFEQVSLEETNYEVLKRSTKPVLIEKLYKGENNKIEQYCEIKFNT